MDDISKLGRIGTMNHLTEFSYYDDECKSFKAASPEIFPIQPSTTEPIYLFAAEMCRAIPYEYERDVNFINGVTGYRFTMGNRALDNGSDYSENMCYSSDTGEMPSGVMNITACSYGSPLFMSSPHFYNADSTFLEAVDGLNPIKEKHQSFITLEKSTGITLEVVARFQSNFLIEPISSISLFEKLPKVMMPTMWVESVFIMDDDNATQLKYGLMLSCIAKAIGIGLIVMGLLMISVRLIRRWCTSNSKSENRTAPEKVISKEMFPLMKPENGHAVR